jgi:hypothetical protein
MSLSRSRLVMGLRLVRRDRWGLRYYRRFAYFACHPSADYLRMPSLIHLTPIVPAAASVRILQQV